METEQMHKAQHANHSSLFDHGLFFPDSGRQATLEALKNAVADSASLITCVGEEGHGKTMLCKILEKAFHDSYLVISFPYSVESFDYVLQVIALKLNIEFSVEDSGLGSGQLLVEIIRALREQKRPLLILFDEAEKLYLATLERIRKMIDLANEDGVLLQIILFGRMGFRTHIEQLALCTFKQAQEIHLVLPPLTEEDTFQYLNFCIRQGPGAEEKEIFSREVAAKILTISHGNFRKINTLAEDSLQSSSYGNGDGSDDTGDATSFMVLLEHVRDADDLVTDETSAHRLPLLFQQKKIVIGAGIALMTILLVFSLSREEKKPVLPRQPAKTQALTKPQAPPTTPNKKEAVPTPPAQPAPAVTAVPVSEPVPPTSVAVVAVEPTPNPPAPPLPAEPSKEPSPTPAVAAVPIAEPVPPTSVAVVAAEPSPEPVTPKPLPEPDLKPEPGEYQKPISVEIAPLVEKKSSEIQVITTAKAPKKNTIPHLTTEPVTKHQELLTGKNETKSNLPPQLPQKSLAAGNKWLAGEKNDHYTLQIMVLAADQAGEKLQGILHDEGQQKGAGKFIVLKKSTPPATVILFYGEYPTLTAAKEARNNLPASLQKYTPYPVAIKQAVGKTKL